MVLSKDVGLLPAIKAQLQQQSKQQQSKQQQQQQQLQLIKYKTQSLLQQAVDDIQPAAVVMPEAAEQAQQVAAAVRAGTRGKSSRRVRFAPGPLEGDPAGTADGHPATEGAVARPVRRIPAQYALDLTKGNVLMLEQMLGHDCLHSVTRLKRRVGLLPPIRAPRPHVNWRPITSVAEPARCASSRPTARMVKDVSARSFLNDLPSVTAALFGKSKASKLDMKASFCGSDTVHEVTHDQMSR